MRALTRTALIVTIVAAVGALSACSGSPANVPEITSIDFVQSQAVMKFDDSTHTTTDPADIAALSDLLKENKVTGSYSNADKADSCPGSMSTDVTYTTADDSTVSLTVNGTCDPTKFDTALGNLVSTWRLR